MRDKDIGTDMRDKDIGTDMRDCTVMCACHKRRIGSHNKIKSF